MLKIVDKDIPEYVAVPCPGTPGKPFGLRRASNFCPSCGHFQGIGEMTAQDTHKGRKLQWHERYAIRCGHMIERRAVSAATDPADFVPIEVEEV